MNQAIDMQTPLFLVSLAGISIGLMTMPVSGLPADGSKTHNEFQNSQGTGTVVYSSKMQGCPTTAIPDAPARAFRKPDGSIVVLAPHYHNWSLEGGDFYHLRSSCKIVLDNEVVDGAGRKGWFEATYTKDGKNITAFVSQELNEKAESAGCVKRTRGGCWINRIVSVNSNDMGRTFSYENSKTIAGPAVNSPFSETDRVGAFTTSNIATVKGISYVIIYIQDKEFSGNCLLRSAQPEVISSWRAWDGSGFNVDISAGNFNKCRAIGVGSIDSEVRSLLYIPKHNKWIAVFAARRIQDSNEKIPGAYYSTSNDLITWSKPNLLIKIPIRPREDDKELFYSYPSLIDPKSTSINFDTIDHDDLILLATRQHLKDLQGSMDRELVIFSVKLNNQN